jgi:hypothetical protein
MKQRISRRAGLHLLVLLAASATVGCRKIPNAGADQGGVPASITAAGLHNVQ